jgi:[acyl-carrier-protein] S-malonyltransferase
MLALLCSGQGRQTQAMFDLFANAPDGEPIFAAASDLLGDDPRRFIHRVDDAALHDNRASQLLCVTRALVAHSCLASALPQTLLLAGYSVGELAAWGVAGIWSAANTLQLTARRADIMDQTSGANDTLGFVRGLNRGTVDALVARFKCSIAILNPDQLFIVGGDRNDVERFCTHALGAGATNAGLVPVHIASHTARLAAAVLPFKQALDAVEPQRIARKCKLIGAASAETIFKPADALAGLASQLAGAIDWSATLAALIEQGADRMLELGPGGALADMVRKAYPSVRVRALDDFHSLDGAIAWLQV